MVGRLNLLADQTHRFDLAHYWATTCMAIPVEVYLLTG